MIPVFPTCYFGSIAYFRALAGHKRVLIEAKERFPKQTYRNRSTILGANGLLSLTLPVNRPNDSDSLTEEVLLSGRSWRNDHWRSIRSAYESSPYFDHYGMEIEELIYSDIASLLHFNMNITERICQWLTLPVQMERSTSFLPVRERDPRTELVQKQMLPSENAPYIQVFPSKNSYTPSISILDAVLCHGPLARNLVFQP